MTDPIALAQLRHLYQNMVNGAVRDTASAKRIAEGLLAPAIEALERGTPPAAPGEPMQEFEKWLSTYSTLSAARDENGYTDMTTEMLWHTWQAATKTKAPEGASDEVIDASARPDLAGVDYTCAHDFAVQPSSGIRLCQKCGISETAARKAAPQQEAQEPYGYVFAEQYAPTVGSELKTTREVFTRVKPDRQCLALYTAPQPAPAPLSDDAKDAARYRWLRNKSTVLHGTAWLGSATAYQCDVDFLRRDDALAALDAAIDAAIAAQGGKV